MYLLEYDDVDDVDGVYDGVYDDVDDVDDVADQSQLNM